MEEFLHAAVETQPEQVPAEAPAPEAPLSMTPKFCRTCGGPWAAGWTECGFCSARTAAISALPAEPPARLGSAIGLYFVLLAGSLAAIIAGAAGASSDTVEFAVTAMDAFIIAVWAVIERRDVWPALVQPVRARWFAAAPFAAIGTFLFASAFMLALRRALEAAGMHSPAVQSLPGYGIGVAILFVCVQPAIFEELAFRGVVLSALRPTLATGEAIVVSALMFMVLHLNISMFPHTLLMGLVLGWMRVRIGSLLPGMLLHFTHNLLCVMTERHWG